MLCDPFALDRPGVGDTLLFDDAPLESILYGEPGAPTPADLFAGARPILTAIGQAVADRSDGEVLVYMRRLYDEGLDVPTPAAAELVAYISRFVPTCAWPIVPEPVFPYDTILRPIFEQAMTDGQSELADSAGSLVARYYEASGRFAEARAVLSALLTAAQDAGNHLAEAQHSNNLGYEFLLEGRWSQANQLCAVAATLFAEEGAMSRANNARANDLTARFGRLGLPKARAIEPEIMEVLRYYDMEADPRRRKPLVLLASIAEDRRDFGRAIVLLEAAVAASEGIPTQHRAMDEAELRRLRDRTPTAWTPT